jgi:SAM-dependent methyltransferase
MQHDLKTIYDRAFYTEQVDGSARSARIVVPLVMKLVRDVRSVVDVGCGTGVWLASFKDAGVPRILGLDGGAAAEQGQLEIDPEEFRDANLELGIKFDESFDLCLCLEVAQHLTDRASSSIVRDVCKLSDVVLFSAAIPGQGGTHHINERWPSYWVDLFASEGYEVLDVIRGRIWHDARVEWCYRQNLLLFANKAGLSRITRSLITTIGATPINIVHPACFEQYRGLIGQGEASSPQVRSLRQRNAHLEHYLQMILNSTSWKITSPLRRASENNQNIRRVLRVLALIGWSIMSGKFLRQPLRSLTKR